MSGEERGGEKGKKKNIVLITFITLTDEINLAMNNVLNMPTLLPLFL